MALFFARAPVAMMLGVLLGPSGCLEPNPGWLAPSSSSGIGDGRGSTAGTTPDGGPSEQPWWDCGWSSRVRVQFEGVAGSTALDELPVLIRLDQASLPPAAFASGGADLRIVDDDGITVLPHEVERWGADSATVWTLVPRVEVGGEDFVWIYHGNPHATDGAQPDRVWPEPFRGVWHLGPDPARMTLDSTPHANHGTAQGQLSATDLVAGQVETAVRFDGIDDVIRIGDRDSLDHGSGSYTVSLWVLVQGSNSPFDTPWYKGGSDDYVDPGYDFELGTTNWGHNVTDGGVVQTARLGAERQLTGRWVWLAGTIDRAGDVQGAYTDGELVEQRTLQGLGSLDNDAEAVIGGPAYAPFWGLIDEVRVTATARSAPWIAAEYRAMRGTLASFGTVQSRVDCMP